MADLINQAGFGDDSIPDGRVETYKSKQGKIDRIGFAWVEPNPKTKKMEPQFIYANAHYVEKQGYILHKDGFEKVSGKMPKMRYGTIILVYSTDKNGEFYTDDKDKAILSYEIKPWYFSEKKFKDLRQLHKKWNLTKYDIEIQCTDETYQNITLQPIPESESFIEKLLKSDTRGTKIREEVEKLKATLKPNLARDLDLDKFNEILGKGSSQEEPQEDGIVITDDDDSLSDIDSIDFNV